MLFGINAAAVALAGLIPVVLQATVVHAWCLLCLATAALLMAVLLLALPEVRASWRHLRCQT